MNTITNPNFFSAGRALFTVSNEKDHRTFKIRKKVGAGDKDIFFVSCRVDHGFDYLGLFNPVNHNIILTSKSKFGADSVEVKAVRFAVARIVKALPMPTGYAIQHEGKCGRCGKELTDPHSITTGIGPDCLKKMKGGY